MSFLPFPIPLFFDATGEALEDGYVYIGEAGMDARENPIIVYLDAALTIPVAQPIRTNGGYPMYQGSPFALYIAEAAANVTVLDKSQQLILVNKPVDNSGGGGGGAGSAVFNCLVEAEASYIAASVDFVITGGYAEAGDNGGADYVRSASEPSHPGKFQSADGAWWLLTSNPATIRMLGGINDGSADDTAFLTNLRDYCVATDSVMLLENSIKATHLDISSTITIESNDAIFIAYNTYVYRSNATQSAFIIVTAPFTLNGNLEINAMDQAHRCIEFPISANCDGTRQRGTLTCHNTKPGGADFNAPFLMDSQSDCSFDSVICYDYNQNGPGVAGLYGGIRMPTCTDVTFNNVNVYNGDQGVNVGACDGCKIHVLTAANLTDNGIYYNSTVTNCYFGSVYIDGAEEGIVLDSVNTAGGALVVESFTAINCTNKGISLREGFGYFFGNCFLRNATMGQSGVSVGVSYLTIQSLSIELPDASTKRAIQFTDNTYITIGTCTIVSGQTTGNRAIDITGTSDNINFGFLRVKGPGGGFSLTAIRGDNITTTTPYIKVGYLVTIDCTTIFNFGAVALTNINIIEDTGLVMAAQGGFQYTSAFKMRLWNTKNGLTTGEVVSALEFWTSDTSFTGSPKATNTIRSVSHNSTGSAYDMEFLDDAGTVAGRILTGGLGCSFVIPTTSANCVSGGIYSNAGILTIKP